MMRFAAILLLTLCLSYLAHAQANESVPSVVGTSWAGIVNSPDPAGRFQDYAYEFEFLQGNKLRWRWRGTVYENGSWQQNGRDILLEMNDGYSTWRGTIEANRMSGNSLDKHGYKWNWVLLRQARALPRTAQTIPPAEDWIHYSSLVGRFEVLIPTEPRVTEQGLQISDVKVVNNVSLALTEYAVFGVSYADLPPASAKSKSLLDNIRKGVIEGINGKLISSANISHKGHPGREFQALTEGRLYTSRIFLVNRRLFQLVLVTMPDKVLPADVQRFLNSFDVRMEP